MSAIERSEMTEPKTCRLCDGTENGGFLVGKNGYCERCMEERRTAWDRYASAITGNSTGLGNFVTWEDCCKAADVLLAERDKRFCRKETT